MKTFAAVSKCRTLLCFAAGLVLLSFSFPSSSISSVNRENFSCKKDEKNLDRKISKRPNAYLLLSAKAECLFKRHQDGEALQYLNRAIENKGVWPAYLKAWYIETDGTFKEMQDDLRYSEIIDEAINAYSRALFIISQIPGYPPEEDYGYTSLESNYHIKISSVYAINKLYRDRLYFHIWNDYSNLLKSSPSFSQHSKNKRLNLGFFPLLAHHEGPLYSLNRLEQSAEECMNTPYSEYWNKEHYHRLTGACKIFKDLSETIRPLENKRMAIAKGTSCKDYIIQKQESCKEYMKLTNLILKEIGIADEKTRILFKIDK